ncbi:uncharacterized protein LOC123037501 [Drosophila rhopaloa]|uniref:Uncharacterized protein n=1 Tax=Drosophila rhopaloa TaxID=1041015 RepID=A0ABM5J6M4_DRORH|nr:uncharacterized protein LOC123037501 [Drosophila rhopaloa]
MLILHHNESRNCALHGWHQPEIPTLRFNQLAIAEIRKHFNHHAVSLVCICNDSDTSLLETLAEDTNNMRQERIILWIQTSVTKKLLHVISNQCKEYFFIFMLILEVGENPHQPVTVLRLDAFPVLRFRRISNIFGLKHQIFQHRKFNFKGRNASLLPGLETDLKVNEMLSPKYEFPFLRTRDLIIIEFANKYNLSLKLMNSSIGTHLKGSSGVADFRLNSLSQEKKFLRYVNPYDISSLFVVVPCGKGRSFEEVIKQLDLKSWLLHIVFVYGIFVMAETFILVVTYKISGKVFRLTSLNPLLNLRAFRALLGMSFPISRRSSLSLRQLFLSISIFGLIFSNFFSCKLSALLTKHSDHPDIKNFDDLRASGLTVIVEMHHRSVIEQQLGPEYFRQNLTNVKFVPLQKKFLLLLSLNHTYAYVTPSESWATLNNYQKSFGKRVFCYSNNLTIIQSLPRTYIEHKNSEFYWPFFMFSIQFQETGIPEYWNREAPDVLRADLNVTILERNKDKLVPLSVNHLKWLWTVLGCGYGLATAVFIIEIFLDGLHRRPRNHDIVE